LPQVYRLASSCTGRTDDLATGVMEFSVGRGHIVRPMPCVWLEEYWEGGPTIYAKLADISEGRDWFGYRIWSKLVEKRFCNHELLSNTPCWAEIRDAKAPCCDPWKGRYWFVLRLPTWLWVPCVTFRAFGLVLVAGFCVRQVRPFPGEDWTQDQGDCTWTDERDESIAASESNAAGRNEAGQCYYEAIVPTLSLSRRVRGC